MKKTVVVGVTSSIAVYKAVQFVSDLIKKDYNVEVIMSRNATEFVAPLTFSSLTKNKTYVDTFDREIDYNIEHISLAKKADVFIIAPATANVIAKVAHGICDDMLTTTFLASTCPKILAPAMNTNMINNPITQKNLQLCQDFGMFIVEPGAGLLACGDIGSGKLAAVPELVDAVQQAMTQPKTLLNKKVLISAGPTVESLDPVRFISNHSSGKMGYALAKIARNLGAEVTLVSGPTQLDDILGITTIKIQSAHEMATHIKREFATTDIVIMAAAVADFTVETVAKDKIKKTKEPLTLTLKKTEDILATLGRQKTTQKICGFAMETTNVIANATKKFIEKNCDLLVVNDLNEPGAGFKVDTNKVSLITRDDVIHLDLMNKEEVAFKIFEALL